MGHKLTRGRIAPAPACPLARQTLGAVKNIAFAFAFAFAIAQAQSQGQNIYTITQA